MSATNRTVLLALFCLLVCSFRLTESCGGGGGGGGGGGSSSGSGGDDGACHVQTYSKGSVFQGSTIKVHSGFVSSMNRISNYASACGVTVYVTSSFRKKDVPLSGAVVRPASRSNHFVGHAIDMNLIDGKWCNSGCLQDEHSWTSGVSCFIGKIRGDHSLRWGGDFWDKDPVHIDDGFNRGDRDTYDKLYTKLQRNC